MRLSGGMAYAEDLKSFVRKGMWVRIPPQAPIITKEEMKPTDEEITKAAADRQPPMGGFRIASKTRINFEQRLNKALENAKDLTQGWKESGLNLSNEMHAFEEAGGELTDTEDNLWELLTSYIND